MTGMAGRTAAAPSGSKRVPIRDRPSTGQKPLKSGGFSLFAGAAEARENSLQFAGHHGVALLNDALLRGLFRTRIRAHSSVGRADDS
jgi:hypothetical protein